MSFDTINWALINLFHSRHVDLSLQGKVELKTFNNGSIMTTFQLASTDNTKGPGSGTPELNKTISNYAFPFNLTASQSTSCE